MAQVNTLHPGNPITDPSEKGVRTSSSIPFVFRQFITQRFGDLQPCLGFEYVPKDDIEFKPEYDLRTYTLAAPLMSDVFFHRDYFSVDMQAILPKNWAKVYTNPLIGDDVQNIVNSFVAGSDLRTLINSGAGAFGNHTVVRSVDEEEITFYPIADQFRFLIWLSLWFSQGSLLASFDYKFCKHFAAVRPIGAKNRRDFDSFFQERITMLYQKLRSYQNSEKKPISIRFFNLGDQDPDTYYLVFDDVSGIDFDVMSNIGRKINFRRFMELAFQNMNFDFPDADSEGLDFIDNEDDIPSMNVGEDGYEPSWIIDLGVAFPDFNFGKIAAYQLCCAHFYSNDHVDYIYSADLYRQLIWSYIMADVSSDDRSFSYNGVQTEYDALSGAMMLYQKISSTDYADDGTFGDSMPIKLAYWTALISYRKSLRFVDYFTGAKAYPLAVGDVSVEVNANLVNIIDVTKNIQKQRFLNAVNRSGRKVQDYMQGIFGIAPDPDHHDPLFLTNIKDPIYLEEVDNTGQAQQTQRNSVTGVLRGNNSQFAFSFKTALPGYLIGIAHFDIPRAYAHHYLKENMHSDRFDMFNPDMQFIGDQAISRAELGVGAKDDPFGYTLRYMEYKIRTDSAAGAFACPDILPGYCFLADHVRGLETPEHISPDYIRSKNVEMDEFYLNLTGYGLADYFHFQIKHVNIIDSRRPMAYAPSIL